MLSLTDLKRWWFNPLLILIIGGPVIDILALLFKDGSFSIAAYARILVLLLLLVIYIKSPTSKAKTRSFYLLLLCAIFFALQVIFVQYSHIMDLVYQNVRMWYFPLALTLVFGSQSVRHESIPKIILLSVIIYSVVIMIAAVLGTSVPTYKSGEQGGAAGWFYSANEVGAIIAIGSFLAVLYLSKARRLAQKYSLIPAIVLIVAPIVNTKVAVFGTIVALVAALVYYHRRGVKSGLSLSRLLFCVVVFMIGYLAAPVFHGVASRNASAQSASSTSLVETIRSDIFSGRIYFLEERAEEYKNGSTSRILLGRGDYSDESKVRTAEMDPFDILFANGLIGFLVYAVVIWGPIRKALRKLHPQFVDIRGATHYMLRTGLVFMLIISLAAGHIIVAPAVSVFLVGIIYYLVKDKSNIKRVRHV